MNLSNVLEGTAVAFLPALVRLLFFCAFIGPLGPIKSQQSRSAAGSVGAFFRVTLEVKFEFLLHFHIISLHFSPREN